MKLTKKRLKEIIKEEILKEDGQTKDMQRYLEAYVGVTRALGNLLILKGQSKIVLGGSGINKLVASLKKTRKDMEIEWDNNYTTPIKKLLQKMKKGFK